jgi:hypothetical protein
MGDPYLAGFRTLDLRLSNATIKTKESWAVDAAADAILASNISMTVPLLGLLSSLRVYTTRPGSL